MPGWVTLLGLYLPVGFGVGLLGSLIGVGGGFFVVPFLLYQGFPKDRATAASLGIVLLSAISGSWANARRKRIDYRLGAILAAGTLPGAWYGRVMIGTLSNRAFSVSFGVLLLVVASYILFVRLKRGEALIGGTPRRWIDSEGQAHDYRVSAPLAFLVSLGIGLIGSLFGIGGGLVLVPFLVVVFGMPAILATAAAQFTFMFASAMSLGMSVRYGQVPRDSWMVVALLGPGVIAGAQVGVRVAKKVPDRIFRLLLSALILVMAYLLFRRA
jgi:uncharacterized membrane protein YfcA